MPESMTFEEAVSEAAPQETMTFEEASTPDYKAAGLPAPWGAGQAAKPLENFPLVIPRPDWDQPAVNVPEWVGTGVAKTVLNQPGMNLFPDVTDKLSRGIGRSLAEQASGMTSPQSLGILGGTLALGPWGMIPLAIYAETQLPAAIEAFQNAKGLEEKAKAGTDIAGIASMIAGPAMGGRAFAKGKAGADIAKPPVIPPPEPAWRNVIANAWHEGQKYEKWKDGSWHLEGVPEAIGKEKPIPFKGEKPKGGPEPATPELLDKIQQPVGEIGVSEARTGLPEGPGEALPGVTSPPSRIPMVKPPGALIVPPPAVPGGEGPLMLPRAPVPPPAPQLGPLPLRPQAPPPASGWRPVLTPAPRGAPPPPRIPPGSVTRPPGIEFPGGIMANDEMLALLPRPKAPGPARPSGAAQVRAMADELRRRGDYRAAMAEKILQDIEEAQRQKQPLSEKQIQDKADSLAWALGAKLVRKPKPPGGELPPPPPEGGAPVPRPPAPAAPAAPAAAAPVPPPAGPRPVGPISKSPAGWVDAQGRPVTFDANGNLIFEKPPTPSAAVPPPPKRGVIFKNADGWWEYNGKRWATKKGAMEDNPGIPVEAEKASVPPPAEPGQAPQPAKVESFGVHRSTVGELDRPIVIVRVNGVPVAFYRSAHGTSGKAAGSWYPFFGVGAGEWFIKGTVEGMERGHGLPEIKAVQDALNQRFKGKSIEEVIAELSKEHGTPKGARQISQEAYGNLKYGDIGVNAEGMIDHATGVGEHIQSILGKVLEARKPAGKKPAQPAGGPSASSQPEATTVHGNVRPPEEPAGQVPIKEGEQGFQPQAGGGVPPPSPAPRPAPGKVVLTPEQAAQQIGANFNGVEPNTGNWIMTIKAGGKETTIMIDPRSTLDQMKKKVADKIAEFKPGKETPMGFYESMVSAGMKKADALAAVKAAYPDWEGPPAPPKGILSKVKDLVSGIDLEDVANMTAEQLSQMAARAEGGLSQVAKRISLMIRKLDHKERYTVTSRLRDEWERLLDLEDEARAKEAAAAERGDINDPAVQAAVNASQEAQARTKLLNETLEWTLGLDPITKEGLSQVQIDTAKLGSYPVSKITRTIKKAKRHFLQQYDRATRKFVIYDEAGKVVARHARQDIAQQMLDAKMYVEGGKPKPTAAEEAATPLPDVEEFTKGQGAKEGTFLGKPASWWTRANIQKVIDSGQRTGLARSLNLPENAGVGRMLQQAQARMLELGVLSRWMPLEGLPGQIGFFNKNMKGLIGILKKTDEGWRFVDADGKPQGGVYPTIEEAKAAIEGAEVKPAPAKPEAAPTPPAPEPPKAEVAPEKPAASKFADVTDDSLKEQLFQARESLYDLIENPDWKAAPEAKAKLDRVRELYEEAQRRGVAPVQPRLAKILEEGLAPTKPAEPAPAPAPEAPAPPAATGKVHPMDKALFEAGLASPGDVKGGIGTLREDGAWVSPPLSAEQAVALARIAEKGDWYLTSEVSGKGKKVVRRVFKPKPSEADAEIAKLTRERGFLQSAMSDQAGFTINATPEQIQARIAEIDAQIAKLKGEPPPEGPAAGPGVPVKPPPKGPAPDMGAATPPPPKKIHEMTLGEFANDPEVKRAAKRYPNKSIRDVHRSYVKQALERGDNVPTEVLADHPDLANPTAPAKAVAADASRPKPPVSQQKKPIDPNKPAQQKKWLLAEVDKAIEEAPETARKWTGSHPDELAAADLAVVEEVVRSEPERPLSWEAEDIRKGKLEAIKAWEQGARQKLQALLDKWGIKPYKTEGHPTLDPEVFVKPETESFGSQVARLQDALRKRKEGLNETVTIEVPGDGTFEIVNSKQALKDFAKRAKSFPTSYKVAGQPKPWDVEAPKPPKLGKTRELEDDVTIAQTFQSQDKSRFVITYVFSDGSRLVATDGRRLIVIERKGPGTKSKPVLIDESGKPKTDWGFDEDPKTKKRTKSEPPQYPNYEQVMPNEGEMKSSHSFNGLDIGQIYNLVRQAIEATDDKHLAVTIWKDSEGRIGFSAKSPGLAEYASGITPSSKPLYAINGQYLLEAIEAARKLGSDKIEMLGRDELSPILLKGKGWKQVIMPMRMEEVPSVSKTAALKAGEVSPTEAPEGSLVRGLLNGSELEKWADKRIKEQKKRFSANPFLDPEYMAALAIKGAALLEKGIINAAEWSAEMIRRHGPGIRPYLQELRRRADRLRVESFKKASEPAEPPAAPPGAPPAKPPAAPGAEPAPGAPAPESKPYVSPASKGASSFLDKVRNTFKTGIESWPIRRLMTYQRDVVDTAANKVAQQLTNDVRGLLRRSMGRTKDTPLDEQALSFVVEADGSYERLQEFRDKIANSDLARFRKSDAERRFKGKTWAEKALDAIAHAEKNWDRMLPAAQEVRKVLDEQIRQELAGGVNTEYRKAYLPHVQDMPNEFGFFETGGGEGVSTGFRHQRTHDTLASSIAAGIDPKSINAADLVHGRLAAGQRAINNRAWLHSLKGQIDPLSKKPVMVDVLEERWPDGKMMFKAPQGYHQETTAIGQMAVLDGYAGLFDALNDPSYFSRNLGLQTLRGATQAGKSLALMIDTFHLARMAFWETIIKPLSLTDPRMPLPSYRKGLLSLDYTPEELYRMADAGELKTMFGWHKLSRADVPAILARKAKLDELIKSGYNIGRVADAMHQHFLHDLPIYRETAGKFNKFVFEDFVRGAMAEVGELEFDRYIRMYKNKPRAEVARMVAKDLNTRFGNLGRQGIFKSKTAQDLARLVALAPQWNEALMRSEVFGAWGALKGVKESIQNRRLQFGVLPRAIGAMMLGQFVINQIINFATRGKPTWDNEEEGFGAKISAHIPDAAGGPGFFLHPFGLAAEIAHLLSSKYEKTEDLQKTLQSFLGSRASTTARPLMVYLTGRDPMGRLLRPEEKLKEAGLAAIPLPIPAPATAGMAKTLASKALGPGESYEKFPGQFQRQLMASAGVKTDMTPTTVQRMYALAHKFNREKGVEENAEFYRVDYADLTRALTMGNMTEARAALRELSQKKTRAQIFNHYHRWPIAPFTGNSRREYEFRRTLTPEQQQAYTQAVADRRKVQQSFFRLMNETRLQ